MPSLVPGYEYDVFISYRQKDNKGEHWVTEFVQELKMELEAAFKDEVNVYFDENPHDGLHEHHDVDESLKDKLKCLVFIPILSRTYCDPRSFAFEHEFKAFAQLASSDSFGLKIRLGGGNVTNRILPVRIYELSKEDVSQFESVSGSALRPIDFIYKEPGVNRPLKLLDSKNDNLNKTNYGNQLNKVGNAVKEIIEFLRAPLLNDESSIGHESEVAYKPSELLLEKTRRGKLTEVFTQVKTLYKSIQISRSKLYLILSFIAGAIISILSWYGLDPVKDKIQPVIYMLVHTKNTIPSNVGQYSNFQIAPDGNSVAFSQGNMGIFIQHFDDFTPIKLKGTESGFHPSFSPDGKFIVYISSSGISKYEINTGISTVVIASYGGVSAHWGIDDKLYIARGLGTGGIWSIPSSGGSLHQVTFVQDSLFEVAHMWPQLLPDKKSLLYTSLGASGGSEDSKVVIQRLDNGRKLVVADKAMFGRYISTEQILYANNNGSVYMVDYDVDNMQVTSNPAVVLSNVQTATWSGAAFFSVSENGNLVYYPRNTRSSQSLKVYNLKNKSEVKSNVLDSMLTKHAGHGWSSPMISPDGKSLAITGRTFGSADIWLFNIVNGDAERVTFDLEEDEFPVWSPSGAYFAYTSAYMGESRRIYIKKAEGGSKSILVMNWPRHVHVSSWSPDSAYLAVYDFSPTSLDIWAISLEEKDSIPIANTTFNEGNAVFSPNGKWLAYQSNESGNPEIYVISFPSLSEKKQISVGGGASPQWHEDGRAIYFIQGTKLIKQSVDPEQEFRKGNTETVFESKNNIVGFKISPDGRTCYYTILNTTLDHEPLRVIFNWFKEIQSKAKDR